MPTINKPSRKRPNERRPERMEIYNTSRWRELRESKFRLYPLCEDCLKQDRVTPADDIHHIKSFMSVDDPIERKRLAFDYNNWRSLCKRCHQAEHNKR